jgi:hypothetical protein
MMRCVACGVVLTMGDIEQDDFCDACWCLVLMEARR